MAFTDRLKTRSVDVTTGEVIETFYTEEEWAEYTAARQAVELPNAIATKQATHKAEARQLVTDTLGDEVTRMKQLAALIRLLNKTPRTPRENQVLARLQRRLDWSGTVESEYDRVKALITAATTLDELAAVPAPVYPAPTGIRPFEGHNDA